MLNELVTILESVTELKIDNLCYLTVISFIVIKYIFCPVIKKFFRGLK